MEFKSLQLSNFSIENKPRKSQNHLSFNNAKEVQPQQSSVCIGSTNKSAFFEVLLETLVPFTNPHATWQTEYKIFNLYVDFSFSKTWNSWLQILCLKYTNTKINNLVGNGAGGVRGRGKKPQFSNKDFQRL